MTHNDLVGELLDGALEPVQEAFTRQATTSPDRVALSWDGGDMTYGELEARSTQIGQGLVAVGLQPGAIVGLLLDRGPELVASLLGVLKAGAVYLGLDASFPPARLALMLDNASPAIVVAEPRLAHLVPGVRVVDVKSLCAAGRGSFDLPPSPDLGDPFYLIYTSGSTGMPKGIVQVHRTLANLTQWQNRRSGISFDATLQFSSIAFDVHLQEIFSTFANGGRVCLIDEDSRYDPSLLTAFLDRHQVTTAFLSVSTFTRLLGAPERLDRLPSSLTDLVMAGEQLYLDDAVRTFLARRPTLRVHNHYGVSESHVVTSATVGGWGPLPARVPIGRPIANVSLRLVDEHERDVPGGASGEIWIAGPCLAAEYRGNPTKTAERFVERAGVRWYRTGDIARQLESGELEFLGRVDDQVKIRGHLVEIGEVEGALRAVPSVQEATVTVFSDAIGERALAAWFTSPSQVTADELRRALGATLPEFMIPSRFMRLDHLPTGATGKVDKAALTATVTRRPELTTEYVRPGSELEQLIGAVIGKVAGVTGVGRNDNFFDVGATSLQLVRAAEALAQELNSAVSPLDLLRYPSVAALAGHLHHRTPHRRGPRRAERGSDRIAIVGAAGRFPGGADVEGLWAGLLNGEEFLKDFPRDELDVPVWYGRDTGPVVTRLGLIPDAERFDNDLFRISARDATWMDPQHRVFLEVAYAALEDAGIVARSYGGRIGVFAGAEAATYFFAVADRIETMSDYLRALTLTDKDFLTSRVAYMLGLEGPAITVQTACSTSLVAVHVARRMLLSGDCDVALAGGVSIGFPQRVPYRHEPALIYSPDGRTRPYDVRGDGTNMTNGAGVVVLKRLQDAAADGDDVIAVIVGSAVNNDGTRKVGYAAPSIDGQVEVMIDALDDAGLAAADIDYMEGHGTATPLGDAIELAAIAEVYGTDRVDPLVLGSIKGNVGHLNRAAGVTGLIKTAYAVRAHLVPATVHHSEPLPEVAAGCIHVPTSSTPLPDGRPVRAAVSSLGIGGTNAHVILESAPPRQRPTPATRGRRLPVVVSAATSHALTRRLVDLSGWLRAHPDVALCDVAHTLATRREALAYRCAIAAGSVDECIVQLEAAARRVVSVAAPSRVPAFMFPGGGTDVAGSLATIEEFGVVNAVVDRAATALAAAGGHDLRAHLVDGVVPGGAATNAATVTHPAIVAHGVAMAAALRELGIEPGGLIGYSLGQYTAAVVAGVLDLEDAIRVVHARARLMDDIAPIGAMSSVLAAEADIAPLIPWPAAIGIRNGPNASVVSGPIDAVELFERRLDERGLPYRRIDVPNPNHTPNMLPMKDLLHEAFAGTVMHPPTIPIVSNVSGSLGGADITDVATWTRHIMEPVRFAEGLDSLVTIGCDLFVDLSDRGVLAGFASMTLGSKPTVAVAGLESPAGTARLDGLLAGVIRLWAAGATVRLGALAAGAPVHLPAYPFGGRHFTLTPTVRPRDSEPMPLAVLPEAEWTSTLRWSRTRLPVPLDAGDPVPERIAVIGEGADADGFRRRCARHNIEIDDALATTPIATRAGGAPAIVVDFRPSTVNDPGVDPVAAVARLNAAIIDTVRGFGTTPVEYWMIARNAVATERAELIDPANASLVSLRRVVEQERASVRTCTLVDLPPNGGGDDNPDERAGRLLAEIVGPDDERVLAWRGPRRLVPAVTPHRDGGTRTVPTDGVVVITGGFGAVGRVVSAHLARRGFDLLVVSRRDPSGSPEAVTLMTDIEAYGRRIDYVQGDVADPATVARAFNRADRMGTVRGLLHLAAHVDAATHGHLSLLDNTMEADLERFAHAKVRGCAALTALTAQRHLDFRVLFSSISTELGGLGYAPYAAANRAAAAVAHNATAAGVPWHVIDWDVWGDDLPATETVAGGTAVPMPSAAATSVLECLLASEPQRFIVSTTDFAARARATARLSRDERVAPAPRRDHDVEAFVEQLWAEALGVVAPPGDRSFLALGGDSLTAIRVVIQLNGALDLTLSPGDMMRAPTLRDFVAVVRAAVALPVTDRVETGGDPGKTSMLQERWFDMWQRGFGDLEVCVALHGPVNETRLQEALEGVVARHRVLSLAYDRIDGELVGCPAPLAACELVDLDSVDRDDQAAAARRAMDRIRASRVCLTREAPFRPTLFHFCEELSVLTIQTHHIAMDGWSASLLVDDLVAIYDGSQQKPAPDYAAFALRQREYLTGAGIDDDRRYWRRMFEGAPGPSRIPPLDDVAGRDEGDTTAVKVVSDLGPLWGRLRDRAAKLGVTPFTLLMGAYALVVSAAIDSDDIVLGTTAAGRGASGEDETVGVFVNPLPVRIRIDAEASIDAYVAAVSEVLIGFHEHQRYLLADLVREVPPFVGLDINETFHTYILMQNFPKPTNASSLQPEIIETDNDHPRSVLDAFTHKKASLMRDLELIMFERDGSLTCNFWYRAGRYPRATVEGWSERFSAAVAALVDTPPFVGAVGDIQNAAPCPPEGGVED